MLTSIAIIVLSAIVLGSILKKIKLPPLLGMIIIGVVLGPYALDIISGKLLAISDDLRSLALVIILTRAGLGLNLGDLRKVGKSAVFMSFVPATFEIGAYCLFGTLLLGLKVADSLLIGSVMAAVSPAVVVPRMLRLKNAGYDRVSNAPNLIIASSSVDDVYVIVLFTAFLGLSAGNMFDPNIFWQVPVSILLGIVVGIVIGYMFKFIFRWFRCRDSVKALVMLSVSFLALYLESAVKSYVPFSALLCILTSAITFGSYEKERANRLSTKYSKLWIFAEIMLFVLIGAGVDISYAISSPMIIAVILLSLIVRMIGVYVSLIGSRLTPKEKLFCMLAFTPKATVQAAIGGVALSAGLAIGKTVLAFAVVGILITAPLGAILIDTTYKKLLPSVDKENTPFG